MYPDFLCIGAQKAGTTWLHDNLTKHPQVWLPPIKEIHYFDRPENPLSARLAGRATRLRTARTHLRNTISRFTAGRASRDEVRWAFRYCFGTRSDHWYETLYDRPAGITAGEICPGYARLEPDRIRHIRSLMPNAKIIYLLRHPVERAWSAAVRHFGYLGGIERAKFHHIETWLKRPKTLKHGDYLSAITNWRGVYGDQFWIGFYDNLSADPGKFLERVLDFLELPRSIPANVGERRNAGRRGPIPASFAALLQDMFLERLHDLHATLQCQETEDWLTRYTSTRILAAASRDERQAHENQAGTLG